MPTACLCVFCAPRAVGCAEESDLCRRAWPGYIHKRAQGGRAHRHSQQGKSTAAAAAAPVVGPATATVQYQEGATATGMT